MEDSIIFFMNQYGYLGIFLLIMIENIFPPIPSEIILGFGGFMTKSTNLTMFGVILISTIGSCLGSLILYFIGYIISKERFIMFTKSKLGKVLGIKASDIENASNWFIKNGNTSILFGRFIPIIRSIISIPAGINKISFTRFLLLTFIGTFIWNGVLTIIGFILGNEWFKVVIFMKKYSNILIIVMIFLIILFMVKKIYVSKKIND